MKSSKNINDVSINAWNALYSTSIKKIWGNVPVPFLQPELDRLKGIPNAQSRVLDAGTGEGRHLKLLLNTNATLHACDSSINALNKISPEVREKVFCAQCSLIRMPYRSGSFDLVLLCDVFETFENPRPALQEIYRILAAGGRMICNIPGGNDGIAGKNMTPFSDMTFLYKEQYLYRFWEENEISEILRDEGFNIDANTVYTWREPPHPGFRDEEHEHISHVFSLSKSRD